MCIQRPNPMTDEQFWNEYERCEHGIVVPADQSAWQVCDNCNEHLGGVQAEGSAGR